MTSHFIKLQLVNQNGAYLRQIEIFTQKRSKLRLFSLVITKLAWKFAKKLRLCRAHMAQRLLNGRGWPWEGRAQTPAFRLFPATWRRQRRRHIKNTRFWTGVVIVVLFTGCRRRLLLGRLWGGVWGRYGGCSLPEIFQFSLQQLVALVHGHVVQLQLLLVPEN